LHASLSSYSKQALSVLREPLRSGELGCPRLLLPEGLMVAQAIKRYARRRVIGMVRRVVRSTEETVQAWLSSTPGKESAVINTAYIERLQANFRSGLAPLARGTRAAVLQRGTLEAGMWLIGTVYNFCCAHRSLRVSPIAGPERRWVERTPAEAAELTDHRWSLYELLSFAVPLGSTQAAREATEMVVGGCC